MSKAEILVIGGSGFIGSHLVKAASNLGYSVSSTYNENRPHLPGSIFKVDLSQENSLVDCILEVNPSVIYYCAKPKLDSKKLIHNQVNVEGVQRALDSIVFSKNALFVFLSTSAIFSGKDGPYFENSIPDPEANVSLQDYANTKFNGENLALDNWSNTIVARLSRVNGRNIEGNLNRRISVPLNQLKKGQSLSRFCDRFISPILVNNLAETLLELIDPGFSYRGILHFSGNQRLSDYEYWLYVAHHLGIDESLIEKDFSYASDNSLNNDFTKSLLRTRFLAVDEQVALMFP